MSFVLLALSVIGSAGCFHQQRYLEQEVAAGRLKIKFAEDISGVSYQIATCQVFGYVFAAAAVFLLAFSLSHLGTTRPL